jgi:hypothetical protein
VPLGVQARGYCHEAMFDAVSHLPTKRFLKPGIQALGYEDGVGELIHVEGQRCLAQAFLRLRRQAEAKMHTELVEQPLEVGRDIDVLSHGPQRIRRQPPSVDLPSSFWPLLR